ncbi:EamA family transporter RarD [Tropicibacter alexandrii]|uniref:EamA family transporter RarD n=1 Tax=Tropicibacter alexandrii TaxID=2267683 RepID=UPI000EF49A6B|nr:EamA family transporter RarD [Tropicibacter alexandrii]
MTDASKGFLVALGANLLWGLFPLYWALLSEVPPLEVFAHRTFWSLAIFAVYLGLQGRLPELWRIFQNPAARWRIIAAAFAISGNWFLFIYAVQVGAVMEASIGYYIFPLLAVKLGFVVFRETLTPLQWGAVVLAASAVLLLTVGLGVAPYLSLALAMCFALYGAFKRGVTAGPVLSVTAEVAIVGPLSLVWLLGVHWLGWTDFTGRPGGFFGQDWGTSLLLVAGGLVTAVPLMMFSYAAKRIRYATIGLIQYVNPTIQFTLAVLVFGQVVTLWHMIALPMIWIGLVLYSASSLHQDRLARRVA